MWSRLVNHTWLQSGNLYPDGDKNRSSPRSRPSQVRDDRGLTRGASLSTRKIDCGFTSYTVQQYRKLIRLLSEIINDTVDPDDY